MMKSMEMFAKKEKGVRKVAKKRRKHGKDDEGIPSPFDVYCPICGEKLYLWGVNVEKSIFFCLVCYRIWQRQPDKNIEMLGFKIDSTSTLGEYEKLMADPEKADVVFAKQCELLIRVGGELSVLLSKLTKIETKEALDANVHLTTMLGMFINRFQNEINNRIKMFGDLISKQKEK